MASADLYELLGINPDASTEEIHAAYKSAAKRSHPDAGGTPGMFRLVQQAHETLSDPLRRRDYDYDREHGGGMNHDRVTDTSSASAHAGSYAPAGAGARTQPGPHDHIYRPQARPEPVAVRPRLSTGLLTPTLLVTAGGAGGLVVLAAAWIYQRWSFLALILPQVPEYINTHRDLVLTAATAVSAAAALTWVAQRALASRGDRYKVPAVMLHVLLGLLAAVGVAGALAAVSALAVTLIIAGLVLWGIAAYLFSID